MIKSINFRKMQELDTDQSTPSIVTVKPIKCSFHCKVESHKYMFSALSARTILVRRYFQTVHNQPQLMNKVRRKNKSLPVRLLYPAALTKSTPFSHDIHYLNYNIFTSRYIPMKKMVASSTHKHLQTERIADLKNILVWASFRLLTTFHERFLHMRN